MKRGADWFKVTLVRSMLLVYVPKEDKLSLVGPFRAAIEDYMLKTVIKYVHTENLKGGFKSIIDIGVIGFLCISWLLHLLFIRTTLYVLHKRTLEKRNLYGNWKKINKEYF